MVRTKVVNGPVPEHEGNPRDEQVVRAEHHLRNMVTDLLRRAADAGEVRDDIVPDELAAYCLHALAAARTLKSKTAIRRLVDLTLAGLRPAK